MSKSKSNKLPFAIYWRHHDSNDAIRTIWRSDESLDRAQYIGIDAFLQFDSICTLLGIEVKNMDKTPTPPLRIYWRYNDMDQLQVRVWRDDDVPDRFEIHHIEELKGFKRIAKSLGIPVIEMTDDAIDQAIADNDGKLM